MGDKQLDGICHSDNGIIVKRCDRSVTRMEVRKDKDAHLVSEDGQAGLAGPEHLQHFLHQ